MNRFWVLGIAGLFTACAQVAEITGGERDTAPPLLVTAVPADQTTNFKGDRITLVFNERIQLDRVRERLLISPPLSTPPTVRLAGPRTVIIDINGPLRENTTYSFGIGEAVKDLTEGNIATGLTHILSTGPYVDSLMIAGRVKHAFTGVPEKEVLVQVYDALDSASIRTSRPLYATRTNANGQFTLKHLRAGEYRLFALRDQNANYRFDLPNESVAFLDSTIRAEPQDTIMPLYQLRLFTEASMVQQIRESKVLPDGALRLLLARPPEFLEVTDIARTGGSLNWIPEWGNERDTVLLWPSDTTALRSGKYQIRTEEGIIDTVRYRPLEKMPFFNTVQASLLEREDGAIIKLRASRPISMIDSTRFQLLRDSLPLGISFQRDTADLRVLYIITELEPGDRVTLGIFPQGITDIYAGQNDTLNVGLGRASEQSTGTLRIRTELNERAAGPFLLQLLSSQGIVLREIRSDDLGTPVIWDRLAPGMVSLRLIEDRNNNGRWDPGVVDEGIQPEHVWHYTETLNIRASWDLGVDWVIGDRPGSGEGQGTEP